MEQVFTERDLIFRRYQIQKFKREGMVPTVTMTAQIDATRMLELRNILYANDTSTSRITITQIIAKAVADTLKNYPILFSFFSGIEIITNQELVLNIPVDIENHVEYIVLHNPERKSLSTIAEEYTTELNRIRNGNGTFFNVIKRLMTEPDKSGFNPIEFLRNHHGNFVISNFGSFHIDSGSLTIAQPIISSLCIGSVKPSVIKQSDQWIERLTLPLTISFDHRPVDGAYAGRFLNDVRKLLESPETLFEDN